MGAATAVQPSFEVLGTPLIDVTFVVVDLETTGLSPDDDRITEVGAVKVRGGDRLGEFQTLVHPGRPVPAAITAVTGIDDRMVAGAPPIEAVLPAFLEFARDSVLVAHNAGFDTRFLARALERHGYPPLHNVVVDTRRLARRLVRDEVRDLRLATLARHLRSRTVPEHRALLDARATVDVLHGLIERAGAYGATTIEDLRDLTRSTSERAYRRIDLVRDAPRACGVYRFLDPRGRVLYVGKATDLRDRLRTYFGQDPRRRIADLVRDTAEVRWQVTPTLLEAEVRELHAIVTHRPHYNRRSKHPDRAVYLTLTRERFPRLSVVDRVREDRTVHLGPLPSRRAAERLAAAITEAVPLRPCTMRIRVAQDHAPCALKDLGRCGAPCDGTQSHADYLAIVERVGGALRHDPAPLLAPLRDRMRSFAEAGRFERAAGVRDRLHALGRTLLDVRRTQALAAVDEVCAARETAGATEVVLIRHGRLVATAVVDAADPDTLRGTVTTAVPIPAAADVPAATIAAERDLIGAWLDRPGVRLLWVDGRWALPVRGGATLASTVAEALALARRLRRDRQVLTGAKVARRAG